jgi:hypothetical protein
VEQERGHTPPPASSAEPGSVYSASVPDEPARSWRPVARRPTDIAAAARPIASAGVRPSSMHDRM